MSTTKLATFLTAFASTFLLACSISRLPTIFLIKDGIHASAKLDKVSTNDATQAHFVHAVLVLDRKDKKLKSVNLNCFTLTIKGVISDEINVDSIASVLTDPYPADAEGRVQVPVYWVFSAKKTLNDRSLPSAQLGVKSGLDSCFRY
jgi:hypothetical protein